MACGSPRTCLLLDNVLGTHCFKWPQQRSKSCVPKVGPSWLCRANSTLLWHTCLTPGGSSNTNVIMVLAWMLWSLEALRTPTELWFGHGCSGDRMPLEHERNYGLGMGAPVTVCPWNTNGIMVWAWMLRWPYALGTRTELWFGHGCSGDRMLLEHERNYGLGMDALVTVCSRNTNVTMVLARTLR